ncbi:PF20097 family protein [Tannockella kyphosi]|uniref:PF20097 family protein n=1 Tax=Tannockella kyphosi TaxID=2899121 RepID=UPI00201128C4|nr:PF20097 family protein [Tannockella kyphosi]
MKRKNCPFCNQLFSIGYIKARGEVISWSTNKKKKQTFSSRWAVEENDIKLGIFNFLKYGARVKCYRCAECKIILIDENMVTD